MDQSEENARISKLSTPALYHGYLDLRELRCTSESLENARCTTLSLMVAEAERRNWRPLPDAECYRVALY